MKKLFYLDTRFAGFVGIFLLIAGFIGATAGYAQSLPVDGSFNQRINSPAAGELDASPNINIDSYPGNVRSIVVQPDGKVLVGGYFKSVNGVRNKSIARLNADGTLDSTFSANVSGGILAIAVQPNGKIIIGGSFNVVSGANRNRIARLNADGSLDTTFNPGNGADNLVYDVAVQADGKILLGGNFTAVNSINNYGVARLNADGSVDTSFVSPLLTPMPSPVPPFQIPSIVYSLAVQADGKIVIGGYIVLSYANPNPPPVYTPIARLNSNGSFDSSFNLVSSNSNALKVAIQADGKILMAGSFSTINGNSRNYIVRFNTDGSLDASFNAGTGPNLPVYTIFVQADGKILLGGIFSTINGTARSRIARLNADGSLDGGFAPSGSFLPGTVQSVVSLPNGKVLVGGSFSAIAGFNNDSVKSYNADGSADTAFRFDTTALGGVRAIAVQADGKIIVGGNFTRPRSGAIPQIFRLNVNGSLDETFAPSSTSFSSSSSGQINSIVIQPDGKILVAGLNIAISNTSGGFLTANLARLNADGTPDSTFTAANIPSSGGLNEVTLQPDGKIIVVWGYTQTNGFPNGGIVRLNADGTTDTSFNSSIAGLRLESVVVQPDGNILVGGSFNVGFVSSQTGSVFYNGIIRLKGDGSRDTGFVPATTSSYENNRVTEVHSLALQPDGKILIGGRIFVSGTTVPIGVARLNSTGTLDSATFSFGIIYSNADVARVEDILLLPNGKILVGGLFSSIGASQQNNVARLNADGSTDSSFNAGTDNIVYEIAAQTDGKVLIGGDFETVNGVVRTSLARLLSESAARRTQFDFDGDGKSDLSVFRPSNGYWYLNQSASGFTYAAFGLNGDQIAPADYDGDGKTDLAVFRPSNGTFYLQRSSAGFTQIQFGANGDLPMPADFDGDGKAEIAIFRPSTGIWYIYNLATAQTTTAAFGLSGDVPTAADYDGDGKADLAVYRPSNGTWYLLRSTLGFTAIQFGAGGDKPVVGDYDGDGKSDLAVWRSSTGVWYLQQSTAGFINTAFGLNGDLPSPADFDGDGKSDLGIFRPSSGTWYLQRSTSGLTAIQFGASGDKPTPNAFVP